MNGERKRYLAELLLSLLLTAAVTGAIIGIRYRSYQAEMDRMALILEAEETDNEIFQSLKEEETISDGETGRILERYGYRKPQDSAAGRQFLNDCRAALAGGGILWLGSAGILGFEWHRKRKEREKKERNKVRILLRNWRKYGEGNTDRFCRSWMQMGRIRAGEGFWTRWILWEAMWK